MTPSMTWMRAALRRWAWLLLGLAESFIATYVDPGLTIAVTYGVFLLVLLVRPTGLFGRAAR